jgi:hypothetical protein
VSEHFFDPPRPEDEVRITRRAYLTWKAYQATSNGEAHPAMVLLAAEAVSSTAMEHPEWDMEETKTFPEWEADER